MSSKSSPAYRSIIPTLNDDIISLLNEYLHRRQKSIHPGIRRLVINKTNITVSSFINSYNSLSNNPGGKLNNYDPAKFERIKNIYDSLLSIIDALSDNKVSENNFNIRCRLLSHISPLTVDQLRNYLIDCPKGFHLFRCLNDVFRNFIKSNPDYKEIFYHRFNFNEDYPYLTRREMLAKLNIPESTLKWKEQALNDKIISAIRQFKTFNIYFYYPEFIDSDSGLIRICPGLCNKIKTLESVFTITPAFIAKVFSVIYNYVSVPIKVNSDYYYYLLKPEYARSFKPILKTLALFLEPIRNTPEFEIYSKITMYFITNACQDK